MTLRLGMNDGSLADVFQALVHGLGKIVEVVANTQSHGLDLIVLRMELGKLGLDVFFEAGEADRVSKIEVLDKLVEGLDKIPGASKVVLEVRHALLELQEVPAPQWFFTFNIWRSAPPAR